MVIGDSAGWLPECRFVNSHVTPDFWNGRQRRFSWRQRRRPRSCLWSRCRSWRWSSRILLMSLPLSSQRLQQFKVQSSCLQYPCNYWFFNFQSAYNSKVVWFPSVFAKSDRAPVESTLCSRWVICGHISSNVEFSLHLGNTIKQSGRDMLLCKLLTKWIGLACLPTWSLRPAQRCRRRPHTRPAPPQSCRRGQVKTQSGGAGCLLFMWRVSKNIPRSCKTPPAPWGTGLLIGSVLLVPLDVLLVELALRSNRSSGTTWFEWFSGVQTLFSILTRLKRLKTWFWPYSCAPW